MSSTTYFRQPRQSNAVVPALVSLAGLGTFVAVGLLWMLIGAQVLPLSGATAPHEPHDPFGGLFWYSA